MGTGTIFFLGQTQFFFGKYTQESVLKRDRDKV